MAGMCTYEDLVAATLPYGLSPLVVPQLKTITLGGAVSGLGIESASFRNGMPHESVLELDILTGAGEVVTASPEQHADLYRAFPNSYGTLGYAVRLTIALEAVDPFVALRHIRYHSLTDLVEAIERHRRERQPGRHPGRLPRRRGVQRRRELSERRSRHRRGRTGQRLHGPGHLLPIDPARPRRHRGPAHHPRLPVAVGHRLVLVLGGVRCPAPAAAALGGRGATGAAASTGSCWRTSSVSGSSTAWRRRTVVRRANASCRTSRCRSSGARSSWTGSCPRCPSSRSGCARCGSGMRWSLVPDADRPHVRQPRFLVLGARRRSTEGETNRRIERKVRELDGLKSLYSDAYYSPAEFDRLYGAGDYRSVKQTYDPDARLLDLYAKAVQRR